MKTFVKSGALVWAVCFLASNLALAAPADVFITENGCGMIRELWTSPVDGDDVVVGDLHLVSANNDNGNINVTCSQDFPPTSTGRSVIFNFDNTDGAECKVSESPLIRTEDWHQVISASGKAKLICNYHQ